MPVRKRIGKVRPKPRVIGKPSKPTLIKKETMEELREARSKYQSLGARMAVAVIDRIVRLRLGDLKVDDMTSVYLRFDVYAVLSYAYYEMDNPLLPDSVFDELCKSLQRASRNPKCPPEIKQYGNLFKSGTGYSLKYDEIPTANVQNVYNIYTSLMPSLN